MYCILSGCGSAVANALAVFILVLLFVALLILIDSQTKRKD